MGKKIIPFGGGFPLSKAIIHDAKYIMEISGQIGMNPDTKELEEGIEKQTKAVMETIKSILEDEGWSMDDVIKVRIYMKEMGDYAKMNEIYAKYFSKDYPTRFVVSVKELPRDALIEIDCTAVSDKSIS